MKKVIRLDSNSNADITASSNHSTKCLYKQAESIADDLAEFLGESAKIPNLSDYIDNVDIEHLQGAVDALYDFAHTYGTDMQRDV